MSIIVFKLLHGGWSTRHKHTRRRLPMHVNYYDNEASLKKYRVCRKVDGETVTFGYFDKVYEAEMFTQLLGFNA